MFNVVLNSLEAIINELSDCDLVRVYLIDDVRCFASLEYVVKMGIDGRISAYNVFVDSDLELIGKVPINLRNFFSAL